MPTRIIHRTLPLNRLMLPREPQFQSKVFRDFKTLDRRNYHSIVHFYEKRTTAIEQSPFEESFEMLLYYGQALHQVGRYEKSIEIADQVIGLSMLHNIQYYHGEDILHVALYHKGFALLQLERPQEAAHILRELIKLNPTEKRYAKLLRKCYTLFPKGYAQHLQGAGILLLLLASGLLVINVLLIQNFYPQYSSLTNRIFMAGIGLGSFLIVGNALLRHFLMWRRVTRFRQLAIRRKARDTRRESHDA